jgi:hypothetical protein
MMFFTALSLHGLVVVKTGENLTEISPSANAVNILHNTVVSI